MGATTTPTTFSDLYVDLLNRAKITLGTTAADTTNTNYAKRYINQALHDVHIQQNWGWAERRGVVITHAPYSVGSLSIASTTRTTVAGTNTLWNTTVSGMGFTNARVGGKLTVNGEDVYLVSTLTSDTALTLDTRYVESPTVASAYAAAYASYTYFEDEYSLASDFWRLVDTRQFSDALPIPVLSKQEFYRRFPRNVTRGTPQQCTIIELGPSGDVNPRPRIVFHPVPNTVYQFPYRYITTNLAVSSAGAAQVNLSADADEPIIPVRYRHVLVLYALWNWYRDIKDDARGQEAESAYVDLVRRMANDSDPQRDRPVLRPRRWHYLSSSAGLRHGSGTGRFSADDRFDQMRD